MARRTFDYLIIGQGLSASLVAWNLYKHQKSFLIIDEAKKTSASLVSAGVINPLIGKKFNRSWDFDPLYKEALTTYQEIESFFKTDLIKRNPILRVLTNPDQIKLLQVRKQELPEYFGEFTTEHAGCKFPYAAFWTNCSCWIDLKSLILLMRNFFLTQEVLLHEKFNYQELQIQPSIIQWRDYNFSRLIFAEGYQAQENPYLKFLPFRSAKGEILDLKIPNLELSEILNFGHFLLPLGDQLFRLGATYAWDQFDQKLPLNSHHPLLAEWPKWLPQKYEIIEQRSAVRPIIAGKLPVIGKHPRYENLFIINGLGSKGALQAPHCAKQLCRLLLNHQAVEPTLDIAKFTANETDN